MDPGFSSATVNLTPQIEMAEPQDGNTWIIRTTGERLSWKVQKKKKISLNIEPKMHLFVCLFLSSQNVKINLLLKHSFAYLDGYIQIKFTNLKMIENKRIVKEILRKCK